MRRTAAAVICTRACEILIITSSFADAPNGFGLAHLATGNKDGNMKYLTDGIHLYEVAAQRVVENYGLMKGKLQYVVLRDCVSEAMATMNELDVAALSEVAQTGGRLG